MKWKLSRLLRVASQLHRILLHKRSKRKGDPMADPMENENLENQNIKHTEGAEMPDTTVAGQVYSRLRADLPAFVAFVSSRAVLLPVL
ncbi:MAG TPA: hypothetical protein DCS07_02265, partial [Bdellovibrionales bacterium]|nr:hypothetical protein [Bdellovibrionales bacterium]